MRGEKLVVCLKLMVGLQSLISVIRGLVQTVKLQLGTDGASTKVHVHKHTFANTLSH